MRHLRKSRLEESEQLPEEPDYGLKDMIRDPGMTWWELAYDWSTGLKRPSRKVVSYWLATSICMIALSALCLLVFTGDGRYPNSKYIFLGSIVIWSLSIVWLLILLRRKRAGK